MQPFWEYLTDWLSARGWSANRLAEESGVAQTLVSRYIHPNPRRRLRPTDVTLRRLAPVLGVPHDQLMRMAGRLDEGHMPTAARMSARQQSLTAAYDRWMAAMTPGMGEDAADAAFWEDLKSRADTRASDAEAAVKTAHAIITAAAANRPTPDGANDRTKRRRRSINSGDDADSPEITQRNQRALVAA